MYLLQIHVYIGNSIQLQSWHVRKWQRAFKHCMASVFVVIIVVVTEHLRMFKSLSCTTLHFVLLKRGRMFNCFRCFGVSLPSFVPCTAAHMHLDCPMYTYDFVYLCVCLSCVYSHQMRLLTFMQAIRIVCSDVLLTLFFFFNYTHSHIYSLSLLLPPSKSICLYSTYICLSCSKTLYMHLLFVFVISWDRFEISYKFEILQSICCFRRFFFFASSKFVDFDSKKKRKSYRVDCSNWNEECCVPPIQIVEFGLLQTR